MDPRQIQSSFNSLAKIVTLALQRGAIQSIPEAQEAIGALETMQGFLQSTFAPPPAKPELKLVPPSPAQ